MTTIVETLHGRESVALKTFKILQLNGINTGDSTERTKNLTRELNDWAKTAIIIIIILIYA